MQHVGAGLQAMQTSTRMRPPDPEAAAAAVVIHAAPGSEAAAKDLLSKLEGMQAQVTLPSACTFLPLRCLAPPGGDPPLIPKKTRIYGVCSLQIKP